MVLCWWMTAAVIPVPVRSFFDAGAVPWGAATPGAGIRIGGLDLSSSDVFIGRWF